MEGKRYQFTVNTSKICFSCLQLISSENEALKQIFSVQNLLRYLKINLNSLQSLSNKRASLLKKTEVKVKLCEKCVEIFKTFSDCYQLLELYRMKVESTLELICGGVKASRENPGLNENYQMEIEGQEQALKHSRIFKDLRDEICKKFERKRRTFQPRVLLKNELPRTPVSDSVPIVQTDKIKQEMVDGGGDLDPDWSCGDEDFHQPSRNGDSFDLERRRRYEKLHWEKIRFKNGRFHCPFCPKSFTIKYSCGEHLRLHTGLGFKCSFCPKLCQSKQGLRTHTRFHTGERPYKCQLCPQGFVTKSGLDAHLTSKHGADDLVKIKGNIASKADRTCSICGHISSSRYNMKMHMKKHGTSAKVRCESKLNLEDKIDEKTVLKSQTLDCNLKPRPYQRSFNQVEHSGHIQRNELGRFVCPFCPKTFSIKGSCTEHVRLHTGQGFKCSICPKAFQSKQALRVHTRFHTGERPYKCPICGLGFVNKSTLNTHLTGKHGADNLVKIRGKTGSKQERTCSICGHVFTSKYNLRGHMERHKNNKFRRNRVNKNETVLAEKKKFECESERCHKSFTQEIFLKFHQENEHGQEKERSNSDEPEVHPVEEQLPLDSEVVATETAQVPCLQSQIKQEQ